MTPNGSLAPLPASRLSRFNQSMTKSLRAWHLLLLGGLGVSLATWTFAGKAPARKSSSPAGLGVPSQRLRSSREGAPADQAVARPDLIIVEAPEVRVGPLSCRFPQGSRLARLAPSDHIPQYLTPGFFTAADPRTSFDGTRVLFAGKQTADSQWQIWEMSIDGSDARQVTHCAEDCLKPAYLPRGQIVYTAVPGKPCCGAFSGTVMHHTPPRANPSPQTGATSQVWVCRVDGSDAHAITFGPGDFQAETVLKNGVILATASSPLRPSHGLPADRELYTLRPDGTGLATLRCDHQHPAIRSQAQELADGTVVFVKTSLANGSVGGDLSWIRRGALHNALLTTPPILASSPQPIGADELLVAREIPKSRPALGKLRLDSINTASGRFSMCVYEDPKLSVVEAVPVEAHEPPRWYRSTLNPALQRGYFICLNAYLAEGFPHGRIAAKLSRIRVLTLDAATQKETLLGDAAIEEDGSFYIAVPPDKPVRFEMLDVAGRAVRSQQSWIWSRSGEERGCVGCHEDRALVPENRWPLALRRFDNPTVLDLPNHPTRSD